MKTRGWLLAPILLCAAASARADQTVNVGPGISFSPSAVTVVPGETVSWIWASGSLPHSTTSDSQTGPEVWDSGVLTSGTFSHTFQTPGSYPFYCAIHSFPGGTMMNGVVVVAAPTATPTPPRVTPPTGPGEPATIPGLTWAGRIVLGLALAAAALLLLAFARPN